jgi:nucleotide-binding universal stress UspA family protein
MLVAPVEKPVASAAYGFVRFIGGGLAPFVASKLAADFNVHVPFYLGAVTVVAAIGVLATGRSLLDRAEHGDTEVVVAPVAAPAGQEPATVAAGGHEPAPGAGHAGAGSPNGTGPAPIVAAVDGSAHGGRVTGAAARIARLLGCPVEVLHVIESDVAGELAADTETSQAAGRAVAGSLEELRTAGVTGHGHLLRVVGAHGDVGRRIADFAADHGARMIVIGPPTGSSLEGIFDADLTSQLLHHASCAVHVIAPDADRAGHRARERIR